MGVVREVEVEMVGRRRRLVSWFDVQARAVVCFY